jgi:hypothetical protein
MPKGSKYKGKNKGKAVVRVYKQGLPVFTYKCDCHDLPATKKACAKGNGEVDDNGFFQSPLGTWNCTITRRKCKVSRHRAKEVREETHSQASDHTLVEAHASV